MKPRWISPALHGFALLLLAIVLLQVFFFLRILCMRWIDPQSSSFERSELWQMMAVSEANTELNWQQEWRDYTAISEHLKRAVVASEDSDFVNHQGFDWQAIEKAWKQNAKKEQLAAKRSLKTGKLIAPKLVGASTISQQLAKNLLLSGERSLLRKAEESLMTFAIESFLSKERILEIYLNHVEWGRGVFGAQAASEHYFNQDAAQLSVHEAARLAVMLPSPKSFEKNPQSPYLLSRSQIIAARMRDVEIP